MKRILITSALILIGTFSLMLGCVNVVKGIAPQMRFVLATSTEYENIKTEPTEEIDENTDDETDENEKEPELEDTRKHATSIKIVRVTKNGREITANQNIIVGDTLCFDITFPLDTDDECKSFHLTVSGDAEFAIISGNMITIANGNTEKHNPKFAVRAVYDFNKNIFDEYFVTVYIPLKSVYLEQITSQVNELNQDGTLAIYALTDLLRPIICPTNSNIGIDNILYYITSGWDYVEIIGNTMVRLKQAMPSGAFTFSIGALPLESRIFNSLTFKVYVKATSLKAVAPTFIMSRLASGDTATIGIALDPRATIRETELIITSGSDLIQKIFGKAITIKKDLAVGKSIKIKIKHLEQETEEITIPIYIPVETLDATLAQTFERGQDNTLSISFNGGKGATNTDWQVTSSGIADATKFKNGKLFVAQSTKGGTVVTVNCKSLDALGSTFSKSFTVNTLDTANYVADWGNDGNVNVASQLRTGRSATVGLTYGTEALSKYGVSFNLSFSSTSNSYSLTDLATISGTNNTVLTVNSNANGSKNFTVYIRIYDSSDGTVSHTISKTINVFRAMSGSVAISNSVIFEKVTTLSIIAGSTWDSTATYGIGNLGFSTESGTGWQMATNGKFTVTSASASNSPSVKLSYNQSYNGTTVAFSTTASLQIRSITLNNNGGSGGASKVIAVNGINDTVPCPSLSGYGFYGYVEYACSPSVWYGGMVGPSYDSGFYTHDGTLKTPYTAGEVPSNLYASFWQYGGGEVSKPSCVAQGTFVTLFDGTQKAVETLDGTELLLIWNLHTGSFDSAPILFIDGDPEAEYEIIHLYFSDGTEVKVIYEHGFWDFNLNEYVFLHADSAQYIGHWFQKQTMNENGELEWVKVQLVNVQVYNEITTAWSPVTFEHLCYYVNGLLSMPGATEGLINIFAVDAETMQYDQAQFYADIEMYGLFNYDDDFADLIPIEIYYAFNGQYLKISMAKCLLTEDLLMTLIERYALFF